MEASERVDEAGSFPLEYETHVCSKLSVWAQLKLSPFNSI